MTANRYSVNYRPAVALLASDLPDTRGISPMINCDRDLGAVPLRGITGYVVATYRETGDGRLQRNYWNIGGTIETQDQIKFGSSWTGGPYRPVGSSPGIWCDTVNRDHYWTGTVDFNTRGSRLAYGAAYSSGSLSGSNYSYGYVYGWTRPTPTTFVSGTAERLRQFGMSSEQYIVNAGWDLTPRNGIYGRYIWNNGSQTRLAYTLHVTDHFDVFFVYENQPATPAQTSVKMLLTVP